MQSNQCLWCKHYSMLKQCKAFPAKIPQEIFNGEFDHRKSFPGDNGIRFESIPEPKAKLPNVKRK